MSIFDNKWLPGFLSAYSTNKLAGFVVGIFHKKVIVMIFLWAYSTTRSGCQDCFLSDECLAWENPWEHSDVSRIVMSDEWSVMGEGWWMMIYKWWVSWEHSRGHSNVHLKYISSWSQIHLNNTSLHQLEISQMFAPLWQSLMHIKSTRKFIQCPYSPTQPILNQHARDGDVKLKRQTQFGADDFVCEQFVR